MWVHVHLQNCFYVSTWMHNACQMHEASNKRIDLTLYPPVTIIIFHKLIRIYMGSLILGVNTYMLFCFQYYGHIWALWGVKGFISILCSLANKQVGMRERERASLVVLPFSMPSFLRFQLYTVFNEVINLSQDCKLWIGSTGCYNNLIIKLLLVYRSTCLIVY